MVEVKTAGGNIERGPATQRHFVREVEGIDGVDVVCSHAVGDVSVSLAKGADVPAFISAVVEWGGEVSLGLQKFDSIYSIDNSAALEVDFL